MAFAETRGIRRQPHTYIKERRVRAPKMIAAAGNENPIAVWYTGGMNLPRDARRSREGQCRGRRHGRELVLLDATSREMRRGPLSRLDSSSSRTQACCRPPESLGGLIDLA